MRFRLLFLWLFAFSFTFLQAQEEEITSSEARLPDTASVFYTTLNHRWGGEQLSRVSDTSLNDIQFYLPTDGASLLYALNGNSGLACQSLVFDTPYADGFRFQPKVYLPYLISNTSLQWYHLHNPYSRIYYNTGKAKEQLFSVTHAQNLARGITLGIDLRLINSIGQYLRQKSDNASVGLQGQFVSDNERYVLLASYRNNRFRWRENGGIQYDSVFTTNYETDRQRIAVRLDNADSRIRESGVFLRQFYYFGHNPGKPANADTLADSAKVQLRDTLHRYFNPQRSNFFRHTFTYSRNSLVYADDNPLSGVYRNIYADSLNTYDSVYIHQIVNDLAFEGGIGRAKGSDKALQMRAGIEYSIDIYRNDTIVRNFHRLTPYTSLSANAFGIARAEGRIWISQGSPFNGDKGIEARLVLPAFDNSTSWGNLTGSLAFVSAQPDYIMQYQYSNHFIWDNSFGSQSFVSLKTRYERRNLSGGFNLITLTNYVYLGTEALPARNEATFGVSQAWVLATIPMGHFDVEAFGIWQKSTDPTVIHLPELSGRLTAAYSVSLFQRAMHIKTGLSLLYNTAYYADAYMPALRAYYLQDETKTGNYPYMDGFINIRVKRARMYLMMKHLNMGMSGYRYFMVPGYPMPDRGLSFGVSWLFYD